MELCHKIVAARKQKGLTQEQLADLTSLTIRTIQRIESGESTPRAYSLKAIATALSINFEELVSEGTKVDRVSNSDSTTTMPDFEGSKHFLKMLCLSCFSYLVIPFIHFLLPTQILKKSNEKNPIVIAFAQKVIRIQLYWKAGLWLLLLGTLAYNLLMSVYFQKLHLINYLVPFFVMYFLNAIILVVHLVQINKMESQLNPSI